MKKFLLYLLLPVILLLSGSITARAQTMLSAGDIAVVRMNEDSPSDGFSFVTFVAIDAGIEIYFTEEGWYGNPDWNGNSESHLKYTAPAGGLSAGSVVHIDENVDGTTFTVSGSGGSVVYAWGTSNFNLSGGDQILAYQTSESSKPSSPTFIAGLTMNDGNSTGENNDPATGWTSSSATTYLGVNVSRIPPGLTNGTNCISVFPDWTVLTENDNARYNCTLTTGTKTALLAAVNNHDNWLYDDATNYATASVCSFTVTSASPEMDVQGNGTSIGDGDITPSSTDHTDFGSVAVASGTVVRTFTILNTGAGSLTLSGTPFVTVLGSSDFTVTSQPTSPVSAGGSVTFQVTFDPSASGTRSATLSIANNDTNENPYNFSIQGVGTAPEPEIKVSGNSVEIADGDASPSTADYTDFGYADISSGSVTYSYTIENQGLAALNLSGTPKVSVGGSNPADFTVIAQPSSPVAVSGSTTFQVTFNPTSTGSRSATLSITNDDTNENPYNFTIQGYGTSQNLSSGDIAFIGYNSDDPDGFTFITLANIPSYELIYFTDEGWNGSAWSGSPTESHYSWQAPVGGLPIGTIVYIYESAPNVLTASSGTMSGILVGTSFYYDSGDQVLAYQSVSGADPASPTFIAGLHADYDSLNYNASTQWSSSALPSASSASTVPTGLTNGQNCVSLFPATTEYGNAKYNGTLTGNSNAIRTAINTYTNWIFDGSTPYDISPTGYATPSITLAAEINLLGNGVSISDGDATPSTTDDTDFGSAAVAGGTVSHTFTIENTGSLTLNLTGIPRVYIAAGDFTVTSQPSISTITSGGSLTFTVEFNPSGAGLRTAELSIINDDSDETPYNFNIQGTGITAPTLTTSAAISIATTTATLGGNVSSDGGVTVTERGVVYSASDNTPQIGEIGVIQNTNGSGMGSFSEAIGSMPLATHYYYQAYATNSEGTSYGGVVEYTTQNQISSISRSGSDPTNASSVSWTVEFSASVTGLAASNFTLTSTGLTGPTITGVNGSGTGWTVTANTGAGSGTLGLNLTSAAGLNADLSNIPFTGQAYTIDKAAPTVVSIKRQSPASTPTNANALVFRVTFNEPVTNVVGADSFGATGTTTTIDVSSTTAITPYLVFDFSVDGALNGNLSNLNGTVGLDIASSPTVRDMAGNFLQVIEPTPAATNDQAYILDNTPPGVTINQAVEQSDPTNTSLISFTVVFSEPVTGFSSGDVTLSGTAGAITATVTEIAPEDGTTYNVAVSGMARAGTVIATINTGVAQDAAANLNTASTSADNVVLYDATAPGVMINRAAGQSDPTNTGPISFTVVFSEPVTGFSGSDVTLSGTAGATTAVVSGGPTTYNVAVSGMAGDGTVIAGINAGVAQDAAANLNTASTSADNVVLYDATAPGVTINQAAGQSDPANTGPISFTVVFSEPVTGFSSSDVTLSGTAGAITGTVTEIAPEDGTTYNVAVSGMAGDGTVIAGINAGVAQDAAANPNTASTSADNVVLYDATAPGVTINQAAGQSDPTNTGPISFTVVFSEPVTGFSGGDVTLSGTAGAITATVTEIAPEDGTTYNVAVSGMARAGTVIAGIPAGVARDAVANLNTASTSADNSINYDDVAPTVNSFTVASPAASFNIPLTVFTASDNVAVTGYLITESPAPPLAGAVGWAVVAPTTYTVASDGSYTLYPWAKDAAGNVSLVFGSPAHVTVDSAAPDTTITNNPFPTGLTNNTGASFTFSGNDGTGVGGLTFACALDGGGFSACSSPKSYGSLTDGRHTFQVRATDRLGNTDPSPASYIWTVDGTDPTVLSITSTAISPTNTSPVPVTITFSEPVCGFHPLAGDLNVINGTPGDLTSGNDGSTVYTFSLIPGGQGLVSVYLHSGSVYDSNCVTPLNYNSVDSATFSITYDTVSPAVTIEQAAAQIDPANVSPVNFTVVFSEPVTGFSGGDVTLSGTAGAITATVTEIAPEDGTTYNVAVSGMTGDGTVIATINAGVAQDAAANPNTASTSADNAVTFTFDTTRRVFVPLVMRDYVVAPDLVVERIVATGNNVQVVIKNQGSAVTKDDFWVDLYFNPNPAPPGLNQPWRNNAPAGV